MRLIFGPTLSISSHRLTESTRQALWLVAGDGFLTMNDGHCTVYDALGSDKHIVIIRLQYCNPPPPTCALWQAVLPWKMLITAGAKIWWRGENMISCQGLLFLPGPTTVHSPLSNQQIIQYKTQYNHNIRHKYNMFPLKLVRVRVGGLKLTWSSVQVCQKNPNLSHGN